MNIGFIGAGKVGTSLGQYLSECKTQQVSISGYYSRDPDSALYASEKTNSSCFPSLQDIARECDILFLTVSDSALETVWEQLKKFPLHGKICCHCSGVETSGIFQSHHTDLYSYSIHPLLAIHNKDCLDLWKTAHITLEGDKTYLPFWQGLFQELGNKTTVISGENKAKYHAAAVFSTNLVLATLWEGFSLLQECGFSQEIVEKAFYPMAISNVQTMAQVGIPQALTGPVARGDVSTVEKHLAVLTGEQKELYVKLSQVLVPIAQKNKPNQPEVFQQLNALLERKP